MQTRRFVLLTLIVVFTMALSITITHAQDISLHWTLPNIATEQDAVDVAALDDLLTLEIDGVNGETADRPVVSLACQNAETQESATVRLSPLALDRAPDSLTMQFDIATQLLGLPYPIDAWALESKPLAIISERAVESADRLSQPELREEFAWTAGYMLETARHSYQPPYGDGLLNCTFETDSAPTSAPLQIRFGRGLPEGVYERDFATPDVSAWPSWVLDESFVPRGAGQPDDVGFRAELDMLLEMQETRGADELAMIRQWDDSSAVGPWIEITMSSVLEHHMNPPRAARAYALVSVAMYEAMIATSQLEPMFPAVACLHETGLQPIVPCDSNPTYPAEHAVVAGAASTVLTYLFPDQADEFAAWAAEAAESRLWAGASLQFFNDAGLALGRQVGELVIARGQTDGSSAVFEDEIPQGDQYWIPEAPAFNGPTEPMAGQWQTWNLTSPDQFRPGPPPEYGSPEFMTEVQEVYNVTQNLTLEQQMIASYWQDKNGTYTPPGHWNAIALELVRDAGLNSAETARIFAALNTAQADAFTALWDAKFTYWSLRPITAIQRLIDPDWQPYIYTPPFPSYISGHSTTSSAAAVVLGHFFPDDAEQLTAWAEEAALSRLYGGIHFRSDNETGLAVGRLVAGEALARFASSETGV